MNINILTLFPEMVMNGINTSITGRAIKNGLLSVKATNIRDYSTSKHGTVDDYPYGGGAGMVMQVEPIYLAYKAVLKEMLSAEEYEKYEEEAAKGNYTKPVRTIYMSPQGRTFSQGAATALSKEENLILLCGHYEGVDERALELIVTDEMSIGDYVLTGGELAAMVITDAVSRLIPGVLNNDDSSKYESFNAGLLEYPQYTRPAEYLGMKVPDMLLCGDHRKVEQWRYEESLKRTKEKRPDLLENYVPDEDTEKAWQGNIKY